MGIKKNNNKVNIEYYQTELYIQFIRLCAQCPLKLYAKDKAKIVLGVGNIMSDIMLVLPPYNINSDDKYNLLNIIQNIYKTIKGRELLEDCYITRSIKCDNRTDIDFKNYAIKFCIKNLFYEVHAIKPKKVIIFDKQLYDFGLYECNKGKFIVKTVISPEVMYYDNQNLKDIFMKQFNEALNDS